MHYEPVKKKLGKFFGSSVFMRKVFYRLLNILLLRAWYIHKELNCFRKKHKNRGNISVLDAGSGFGQYSYYLAKKNPQWNIDSVDIKTGEINDCKIFFKKTGLKNVIPIAADLTSYSNNSKYDLVLSIDVMEHIENDKLVFHNFYNSMKENGMLLISTPSVLVDSGATGKNRGSFTEEHVRDGYSKENIASKLKEAGFNDIDTYYTYGKYGNIAWRLSIKYPLLLGKNKWMLPLLFFYYIIVMPFCLLLNFADTKINNKKGTGLIVKAYK